MLCVCIHTVQLYSTAVVSRVCCTLCVVCCLYVVVEQCMYRLRPESPHPGRRRQRRSQRSTVKRHRYTLLYTYTTRHAPPARARRVQYRLSGPCGYAVSRDLDRSAAILVCPICRERSSCAWCERSGRRSAGPRHELDRPPRSERPPTFNTFLHL